VEGEWILQLPAGNRRVEIDDETMPSAAVDAASVISSQTIVWFGQYFVLTLFVVYSGVRCRRFWRLALARALLARRNIPVTDNSLPARKIHTGPL